VHELLRVLSATKEAADAERRRRIAWEQEQEAKYVQIQAEMEMQMLQMRQEVSMLKASMSLRSAVPPVDTVLSYSDILSTAHIEPVPLDSQDYFSEASTSQVTARHPSTPNVAHASTMQSPIVDNGSIQFPMSPLTPASDSPPYHAPAYSHDDSSPQPFQRPYSPYIAEAQTLHQSPNSPVSTFTPSQLGVVRTASEAAQYQFPAFVEGSSTRPIMTSLAYSPRSPLIGTETPAIPPLSSTPRPRRSPTPALPTPQSSETTPETPTVTPVLQKRPVPVVQDDESEDESSSENGDESPVGESSRKRANGHDGRCLTIHHAMRCHILRVMKLKNDKELPDSYIEGQEIPPDEPVRFVWEKTPKQSHHNAAMKRRVIADLKFHRSLYKYVPDKDFAKRNLDSVFDQAFTTLRQKFRSQKDGAAAMNVKKREDQKARKARRHSRKKQKLTNRAEARKKLDTFAHAVFDAALQPDCMSSEESGEEEGETSANGINEGKTQVLRIRGLPWRSMRLQRFYATLDEEDVMDKAKRPKRGVGRKQRRLGPFKDGVAMPPPGAASWMISKRWLRHLHMVRPDLAAVTKSMVVDPPGFDWSQCVSLGAESDDELDLQEVFPATPYIPYSDASYSLQYALTPMP